MTPAQHQLLVDGHNAMHDPKRRRRARGLATHADIAALKQIRVASG